MLSGLPAFALQGLPAPTGLFLASEGSLGVVGALTAYGTEEVAVRASENKRELINLLRPAAAGSASAGKPRFGGPVKKSEP